MKRIVMMSVLLVGLLGMFANTGFAAEMKNSDSVHSAIKADCGAERATRLEDLGFIDQKNVITVWAQVSAATDPVQLVAQVKEETPDVGPEFYGPQ